MRPCTRCATLDGFVDLARSLGLDAARQAAQAGIDVADLGVPEKWIPAAAAARLLEMSAADSAAQDFGLRLSERRRLTTLGPLSVALREEPDLRSALLLLIRYEHSYNEAVSLELVEAGELATMRLWLGFGEPAPVRQALELGVAAILGVIRELVGTGWHPRAVCFPHGAPARLTTHRRLLGAHVEFDQEFTGLVFRARELTDPNVLADPLMRPYRRRLLRVMPSPRPRTLTDRVRELIETLLPLGRCSMDRVARSLGLTPRTLRRRLDEEHESYSSIVEEARRVLAERYLSSVRLSLTDISYQLGFGAPSAFARWFRHQFGMSPTAWRDTARSSSPGIDDPRPPCPATDRPCRSSLSGEPLPAADGHGR